MPLFDLVCDNCLGEIHDVLKKKDTLDCCPKCGGYMSKKVGRTHFELKGNGWAKDGYGK